MPLSRDRTLEKLLEAKNAELARSNAELAQFASVASHDLKEPLNKIGAFAELITKSLDGKRDAETRDYLERMVRAIADMRELIDDLQTLSRVTTRGRPLEDVSLNDAARLAAENLEGLRARCGGTIEIGELPSLRADPVQMRQLLQNLIGNALKFRKKDVPPLVRVAGRARGDGFCELSVADNGIGFEQKFVDRIFKPFTRLHSRLDYDGTGMGLAICEKIALRHGGAIAAESAPGRGATFVVTLPTPY